MCVILACERRPDRETLEACASSNPHGAGVAWFSGGGVEWRKNLVPDQVGLVLDNIPLPYVIHFRIATVGGVNAGLCHPFPLKSGVPLDLAGKSSGVLFHNGHCSHAGELALAADVRLKGPASDTRQIAAVVHKIGLERGKELIASIGDRFALMQDRNIALIGQWTKRGQIWYSNLHWERTIFPAWEPGRNWRNRPVNKALLA